MSSYRKESSSKQHSKLLRIELLLALIGSGSALSISIGNITTVLFILFIVIILCRLLFKATTIHICFHDLWVKSIAIFLISLLLPTIFRISSLFNYAGVRLIISLCIALVIILFEDREMFLHEFVWLIRIMALFSIICYLCFNILHMPFSWMLRFSSLSQPSVTSYYSLIFYNILPLSLERNCGPFWEPSIFACYLSIAMVIRLFLINSDKKLKFDIILFVITMITTLSATGFLLSCLIVVMYIWKSNYRSNWIKIVTIISVILIVIFSDFLSELLINFNPLVFNKIFGFSSNGSSMTRIYSMWINLNIWMKNPIIGNGLANTDNLYISLRSTLSPKGLSPAQTSTNAIFLAAFGVFGIYYTIICIFASRQLKFNNIQKLIFLIILLIVVNTTPQINNILTYCLLFFLIKPDREANN